MRKKIKTAIYVHGLDTGEEEDVWSAVMWGKPPYMLGRATKGIQLLYRDFPGALLVFGSGKTHQGDVHNEGQQTLDYVKRRFDDLLQFRAFDSVWSLSRLRYKFEQAARYEPSSDASNTQRETESALKLLPEQGIRRIIFVSDPVHIPRCANHAVQSLEKFGIDYGIETATFHSDVKFRQQLAVNSVVFEPPPDGTNLLGDTAKRFFSVPADFREQAMEKINAVLDRFSQKH